MRDPHLAAIEALARALYPLAPEYLVLGSFVTRAWMGPYHRPCRDLDLMRRGVGGQPLGPASDPAVDPPFDPAFDPAAAEADLRAVVERADDPQIRFDPAAIEARPIWAESISPGVRLEVPYIAEHLRGSVEIDISAADPIASPAIEMTVSATSGEPIRARTVTLETMAAWKLHGLFEHIRGMWLPKTLWDLYVLLCHNRIDGAALRSEVELAFSYRLDPREILQRFLYGDFAASSRAKAKWGEAIGSLLGGPPPPLDTVLAALRELLQPLLEVPDRGTLRTLREVTNFRVERLRSDPSPRARLKLKSVDPHRRVLPYRAYPSIPHLPGSRLGPSERVIDVHQRSMLTERARHPRDRVIVQEKLDGSCVCAWRRGGQILALGRGGDLAELSANAGRRLWADWAASQSARFLALLREGERACGEWMALAHGERYELHHEPFVLFDLFDAENRPIGFDALVERASAEGFVTPHRLHDGAPIDVESIDRALGPRGFHGAQEAAEGAVWRLERDGRLLFRAKYVRPHKRDGCLLADRGGGPHIWNWRPRDLTTPGEC